MTRQVSDLVHADTDSPVHVSRGVLLCDAARGIIAAARRLGVITDADLARTAHPHAAPMPGEVPSEEDLERRFPHDRRSTDMSWGSLWSSLDHELGDFGRYEVGYHTSHFSRLPINRPRPSEEKAKRDRQPPALDTRHVAAFHAALPMNVRDVLATPTSVLRLLDEDWLARKLLDDDQYRLLHACPVPPPLDEQLFAEEQDAEWASRWILMRVAELGWSPRLFGAFDGYRLNNYSHDSHRPERMGKKYQWIALHDLLERLANHYHVAHKWDPDPHPYRGAWELNVRDIDPSLPPTTHPLPDQDENPDADDDPTLGHTFPPADSTAFWAPPTPALPARDDIEAWIYGGSTIPALQDMSLRIDPAGTGWTVLTEFAKDTPDGRGFAGPVGQAEQWHHIDTWLVTKNQTPHIADFVRTRSLIPRWMPEEPSPNGIYLSEYPDAAPAQDLDIDDGYSHRLRHSDPHDQQPSPRPPRTDLLAELLGEDSTVNTLDDLATLWSNVDIDDEPTWTAEPHDHNRPGDGTGTRLRAIPATVFYSWSGNEADCSINEAVSAHLPTNRLLRDSGLVRHPDRPDWYDFAGTLAITYRWGLRPTGEVRTLLVRQDWLTQRLNELGYDLIVGLIGELQTTREVPAAWRQFSQCTQLQANGALDAIHTLTTVRHRRK